MRIPLAEIWDFTNHVVADQKGWTYCLVAGKVKVPDITSEVLADLKSDTDYDTELLPSIFTFREILWQPDVYPSISGCLPAFRILRAYCKELIEELTAADRAVNQIYMALINGVVKACNRSIKMLSKDGIDSARVLGEFRVLVFPIIRFFIFHPKNRKDYRVDALHRLNYAVKIILTELNGKYSQLVEPYWEVVYKSPETDEKEAT